VPIFSEEFLCRVKPCARAARKPEDEPSLAPRGADTSAQREALGANKEPSSQHLPAPKEAKGPATIPPLPASWWQGLLYGSPDAMLSAADATRAMHLIAQALGVNSGPSEFSAGVRGVALRKILDERFGAGQAWRAMNELWRSASPSPGAPSPNQDQSQMTPGSWPVSPDQPRWATQLNEPGGTDRD
jgi:hypothetical protein